MKNINDLIRKIIFFRDERNWKQFHNPKDLAISLVLEANELLEHFQWKNEEEVRCHVLKNKESIGEELADILYWVLLISHDLEIDILDALNKKIKINKKKYPTDKAKGNHTKYNKL